MPTRRWRSVLAGTGAKAGQRALHRQCANHLLKKLKPDARRRLPVSFMLRDSDVLWDFFTEAVEPDDVDAVAWLLWADWLAFGPGNSQSL
jgi:hypothetical protein